SNITVATDSVELGAGSLTSVSAAGMEIPYGVTIDGVDGRAWTEANWDLSGPFTVRGAPTKLIVFGGAHVDTAAGAVGDASGGGDIYATEFVAGTGGSRNLLTTTSQTVYALVPRDDAGTMPVAPYDPTFNTHL